MHSGSKQLEIHGRGISATGFKSVDEVIDVVEAIKQLKGLDKQ